MEIISCSRVADGMVNIVMELEGSGDLWMRISLGIGVGFCFFFFQAEDGIRDIGVTEVQTCALPILLRLPWDYRDYGLDPDAQPVADAIRASLAIPFFFSPQTLRDPRTGRRSTLLDGGVLSNFPVEIFDRTDAAPPRWPTFGVGVGDVLSDGEVSVFPHRRLLPPPVRLLDSLVATTVNGRDRTYLAQPCVRRRAISIDTSGTRATDFDISPAERARLVTAGTTAARDFLAGWDWADYLCGCRGVVVTS